MYALATSDDARALAIAREHAGIEADRVAGAPEIRLIVDPAALDGYAVALGRAGVAVRRLELLVSPLKTLFFSLTGDDDRRDGGADEQRRPRRGRSRERRCRRSSSAS